LKAKLAVFEQNAGRDAILRTDCLAFDDSPEAEKLRRYELSCGRTVLRSLSELARLRRAAERAASQPRLASAETIEPEGNRTADASLDPATQAIDSIERQDCFLTGKMPVPLLGESSDPAVVTDFPGAVANDNTTGPADPDTSTSCDCVDLQDELPNLDNEPRCGGWASCPSTTDRSG